MRTRDRSGIAKRFLKRAARLRKKPGTEADVVACYRDGLKAVPDDAELQYRLGHALYWGTGVLQDYAEAAAWLRKAASQNHVDSLNDLGVMYLLGAGAPQCGEHAAELFRRSAEQGDTWAMGKLGFMFYEGQGVPQDFRESCFWYCVTCECELNPYDAFEAAKWRDRMADRLPDSEIIAVRTRARAWLAEHPCETLL
jgi:hypothetical protein